MTVAAQSSTERRTQLSTLIDELIQERHQVWSLYCRVAEFKPFSSDQDVQSVLKEFCQILVDYISLGHFGIYQRILEGKERRAAVLKAAETIYPEIAETTEAAVSFNDKYDRMDVSLPMSYYHHCLEEFQDLEDYLVLVISDDIEEARSDFGDRKDRSRSC